MQEYENDYLTYRELSFWDKVTEEYDLRLALFGKEFRDKINKEYESRVAKEGKEKADEWKKAFDNLDPDTWLRRSRPLHLALEKLWKVKGFTTYGQYEDWEREHIPDRNEYLKNEGVWDLWVNG